MTRRISSLEKKKRSIIRRILSGFINSSNSYIVQYLPDIVFSKEIAFQAYRKSWIFDHKKNNDSDLIRLLFIISNIEQLRDEGIQGDIAELGVYKGNAAKVLHDLIPDRAIYLLDTYEGFSQKDLTSHEPTAPNVGDYNAGLERVKEFVGTDSRIHYIKGYFPETARHIPENCKFCFVNLDVDLYEPIKAGLEYFYPRMSPGGIIVIHDYANSWWPGVKKAVNEFLSGKPEKLTLLPDKSGTASFRKY